jgi:hypothetical protein
MTTWTIDTVTPALFLAAKEPFQKQADAALQRHSELQSQLATTTAPIRFNENEIDTLINQYIVTSTYDKEYLYSCSSIQEVITTSTELLESLDSDLTILWYTVDLNSDQEEYDSYYDIRKYKLATVASVTAYWERHIINNLKSKLNTAIRPKDHYPKEIPCPVLKLWLDGTIDNKTLQTLVYGICEL